MSGQRQKSHEWFIGFVRSLIPSKERYVFRRAARIMREMREKEAPPLGIGSPYAKWMLHPSCELPGKKHEINVIRRAL